MARCLIGCGSNVGNRHDFLDRALDLLRFMPGVRLQTISRYRETRPVGGPPGQTTFLNAACVIETDLPPREVLAVLAAVENTLERAREQRWGPRTVDLDLLLYDDLVMHSDVLTLPHPRMATRRFVLEPSVEIAPDLVHPQAACTLVDLLQAISVPHPHIAVIGVPGSGAPEVALAIADVTLARLVQAPREYLHVGSLRHGTAGTRDGAVEGECRRVVTACAERLAASDWPDDPHGTVVDFWMHSVFIAAAEALPPEEFARFQPFFREAFALTVPPHVAIMLRVSPAVLEERIAFRSLHAAASPDTFADLDAAAVAVCEAAPDSVARLADFQDRLSAAVWGGTAECGPPRAVIAIDADDLGQAIEEAVAAVEAMA